MYDTEVLGTLASGQVVVDRYNSHLHPGVKAILPEALAQIHMNGEEFQIHQVDFDRVVGQTTCVETSSKDEIVYAKRPKRYGYSRFVLNREAEDCSSVVVILKKGEDYYVLITAFIGEKPEPEPWDRNATSQSESFWRNHALIWGSEPVLEHTITRSCPW